LKLTEYEVDYALRSLVPGNISDVRFAQNHLIIATTRTLYTITLTSAARVKSVLNYTAANAQISVSRQCSIPDVNARE
jgi:hypothetical protein